MATRVSRDTVFYAFSPDLKPVTTVKQNEEVIMETHDCFQGQLKKDSDLVTALDWSQINPATGPVYIEGSKPGDILRVDLLDIKVAEQSVMVTIPGEGALGDVITQMETSILKIKDGEVIFKDKIRIPQSPMIGVIGVAPQSESIPTGTPGFHGGNMDCNLVQKGASLYFTVNVEGALVGAGDFHAVMGDGEIVVCGAEVPGEVHFKAEVVDMKGLPTPFIENKDVVAAIYSALTTDEAAAGAIHNMSKFLTEFVKLTQNDAGMLMSLVGNLIFCQVVDPLKTVRFEFPKWVLEKYDYKLG